MKLEIFEPPGCCPGGLRGPSPAKIQFTVDVEWLRARGVAVERSGIPSGPRASPHAAVVLETIRQHGIDCLPVTLADGEVVMEGRYPSREQLAALAGVAAGD